MRNKKVVCVASLIQKGDEFIEGSQSHKCTPNVMAETSARARKLVKERGKERLFATGPEIAKEPMALFSSEGEAPLKMQSIVRAVNRAQKSS